MWKDKSPGVKILWFWTIGTAAVLVGNVASTRMRDLQKQTQMEDEDKKDDLDPTRLLTAPDIPPPTPSQQQLVRDDI